MTWRKSFQHSCVMCGVSFLGGCSAAYCADCRKPATQTMYEVQKAMQYARLPKRPIGIQCVDCGDKAQCWDHRDYSMPLAVEPVCNTCNKKRGPADWSWLRTQ